MEDRAAKFKKFIERLPRLCSPTICGTLSQPTTKSERNTRTPIFEWSLEQKAILSPANITAATSSEIGEIDHSFLHQESEQFFSQKCIAPSPMTTPSTRPFSRSQPAPKNWSGYMFDERDEETDEDEEDEDDGEDRDEEDQEEEEEAGERVDNRDCSMMSATSNLSNPARTQAPRIRSRRRMSRTKRESDTDIDMDVLDDQTDTDTDTDGDSDKTDLSDTDQENMTDVENNDPDNNDDKSDDDDDDDYHQGAKGDQDMDSLFLSPPMRSSQSQQRFDIFSPDTFGRVMEDENTLQSTPKLGGSSQIFNTPRARRVSGDMSD